MPVRWHENKREFERVCPHRGCTHVAKGKTMRQVNKALTKHLREVHGAQGS